MGGNAAFRFQPRRRNPLWGQTSFPKINGKVPALEIGISRAKLSKLLEIQFADCPTAFLQRISGIIAGINSKLNQENRQNSDLLALSKAEIRKAGISKFARLIKLDPSNLAKIISGNRALSATVLQALRIYFAGRPKRR
jgi:hypothetical protein